MEGATHYLEVYKTCNGKIFHSPDYKQDPKCNYFTPIKNLYHDLSFTSGLGFKTIAIWYIKPKVKTNN